MKKVIITGFVRTGTTFVADWLDTHKEIRVERDFFNSFFRVLRNLGVYKMNQKLSEREKNLLLSELKPEAELKGITSIMKVKPTFETPGQLLELATDKLGKGRIKGFKITRISDYITEILEKTDFEIIYLVRDPRDILLSAKNRISTYNDYRFIKDLKEELKRIKKISSPKFTIIKFEELIESPEKGKVVLEKVLGMKLLIPKKGTIACNSSFHDVHKPFDRRAIHRWKKSQNDKSIRKAEHLLRNEMCLYNYKLENTSKRENIKFKLGYFFTSIIYSKAIIKKGRKLVLGI